MESLDESDTSEEALEARIICSLVNVIQDIHAGQTRDAFESTTRAVVWARMLGNDLWLVRALREFAVACQHVEHFVDRTRALREAVELLPRIDDSALSSCLFVDASAAEYELGRYRFSLELLERAEACLDPGSIGDQPAPFALIAVHRARALRTIDRADEALLHVEHALRAFPLEDGHLYTTYLETEEVRCLVELGENVSEERLQELAARCARRGWWLVRDDLLRVLARTVVSRDPERAVALAREAVTHARDGGDTRDLFEGLELLARLLRGTRQETEAADVERELSEQRARMQRMRDDALEALAEHPETAQPVVTGTPVWRRPVSLRGLSIFDALVFEAVEAVSPTACQRRVEVVIDDLDADDVDGGAMRLTETITESVALLVNTAPAGTRLAWSSWRDAGWCYLRCERTAPPARGPRLPGADREWLARLRRLCHASDGWMTSDTGPARRDHVTMAWHRTATFARVDTR